MFHVYWPVTAFVGSTVVVAIVLMLGLGAKLCRARMTPLPERDISTYMPETEQQQSDEALAFQAIQQEHERVAAAEAAALASAAPASVPLNGVSSSLSYNFNQGMVTGGGPRSEAPSTQQHYNVEVSIGPGGRREYGI